MSQVMVVEERAAALRRELVVFIAAEAGLAERLLAVHVADDHGRCRACPNGAAANLSWPCPIHDAAAEAKKRRPTTNRRRP